MIDREKVIKTLTDALTAKENYPWAKAEMSFEFIEMLLDLLKEQEEPKQIVRKQCKTEHSDGSIDYYAEWFCPHCSSLLKRGFDAPWIEYCFKCGKPITWEGR